jgi:uncharacterized membrane protein YdjX (TVP38/TMEM64 family)
MVARMHLPPFALRLLKPFIAVAGVVVLGATAWVAPDLLPRFTAWVASLGVWGPVVFIAGYSLAPVVLAPAFLLTIASGALFGFWAGLLYVMIGATVGATFAFLIARYLARPLVESLLASSPKLVAIDRAVELQGFRLVALLRLSPAVPYVLLNYALGLSRVRLADYMAGTIGMLPVVAMYVYTGKVAGDLASLATGATAPRGGVYYTLLTLGLGSSVAVTVLVSRMARRAVDAAVDEVPTRTSPAEHARDAARHG